MKFLPLVSFAATLTIFSVGCAHKGETKTDAVPVAAATPEAEPTVTVATASHYTVRKGDSLWSIASRHEILGDSMHWPLLYRQNRDQIQDPDLIEINEDLSYGAPENDQDIADAMREAEETPLYVPHMTVRKSLPLKY
jgi:hypothetical protein